MVSVIAVAIISILTELYLAKDEVANEVSHTTGRRKRKSILLKYNRKKIHYLTIFVFWAVVSILLTCIYIKSKKNEYNIIQYQAENELNNRNFAEAAKLYEDAYFLAYNDNTQFTALYGQATCYLLLAVETQNEIYVSNLFRIFDRISDPKYKKFEFYKDIPVDICLICSYIHKNDYNSKISEIISELENTYDFSDIDEISDKDVDFMNKVALAIGMYYKNEAKSIKEKLNSVVYKEYANKAIFYYNIVCKLMERANKFHYNQVNIPILYTTISEFMVNNSLFLFDGSVGYTGFDDAINFCKNAIKRLDISNNDDITFNAYVDLTVDLGKAYVFSAIFVDKKYYDNAYEVLHPLLQLKSNNIEIEFSLLDAGLYLVQIPNCTDDDIEIILDRYEETIRKLSSNQNISDYIKIMESACTVCDSIILNHKDSERAQNLKYKYSQELKNLSISKD